MANKERHRGLERDSAYAYSPQVFRSMGLRVSTVLCKAKKQFRAHSPP